MGSKRLFTICLMFVILSTAPLMTGQMDIASKTANINSNAEVVVEEFLPNPDFEDTPTVVVNGSSGEYDSYYHSSTGPGDQNYLNLTFNHVANTSLDFRTTSGDIYPDCNDFIYTYQEVEWTNNVLPRDAVVNIEFAPFHTGNFTAYQYDDYVRLYVWVIDSSGNWVRLGDYPLGYGGTDIRTRKFDFDYLDITEVFGGMFEVGGVQDDPSDTLRVMIGISPLLSFYGGGASGPWSYLNGSLTVQLLSLRFEVVSGDVDYEYDAYPSVGFGYWGGEHGVIFPDMAIGDDDSTYVIGHMSDYETMTTRHCLVKFNPLGAVAWSRSIDRIVGEAVAVSGANIYTLGWTGGNYDVALVKWNDAGNKIWNKSIDLGGKEYGKELAVCTDGSVIIVGDSWREDPRLGTVIDSFIMKTDSEGEVLWTKIHENMGFQDYDVLVDSDDRIFARNFNYPGITEWSQSGNLTSEIYSERVCTLTMESDYFIVSDSRHQSGYFNISKITKDGTLVWTSTVEKSYGDLWSEWILADGIAVSSEENVYVIAKHFRFELRWVLYKFDSNGMQEWNQSILAINWRNLYNNMYGEIDMEMGNNDLLYIGGHWFPAEEVPTAIAVAVYNPEGAPVPLIVPLWLVASGVGIGIIAIAVVIFKKKRM